MDLLYIIGEPGVGKSTLVEGLTAGLSYEETNSPFAFRRYDCGVLEPGRRRESFSGTDALAMDVQPKVVELLESMRPRYVLAEGDRLANGKFFRACSDLGYDLQIVYLFGSEVARQRRIQRGSKQDQTWLMGRQTKAAKLAAEFPAQWLSAAASVDELVTMVEGPVADRLREVRVPA